MTSSSRTSVDCIGFIPGGSGHGYIGGMEMDKVHELEAMRDARPLLHPDRSRWACALCEDWHASSDKIAVHLLDQEALSLKVCLRMTIL